MKAWSECNVQELKAALRERGLPVSGRKQEMLNRLLANNPTHQQEAGPVAMETDEGDALVAEDDAECLDNAGQIQGGTALADNEPSQASATDQQDNQVAAAVQSIQETCNDLTNPGNRLVKQSDRVEVGETLVEEKDESVASSNATIDVDMSGDEQVHGDFTVDAVGEIDESEFGAAFSHYGMEDMEDMEQENIAPQDELPGNQLITNEPRYQVKSPSEVSSQQETGLQDNTSERQIAEPDFSTEEDGTNDTQESDEVNQGCAEETSGRATGHEGDDSQREGETEVEDAQLKSQESVKDSVKDSEETQSEGSVDQNDNLQDDTEKAFQGTEGERFSPNDPVGNLEELDRDLQTLADLQGSPGQMEEADHKDDERFEPKDNVDTRPGEPDLVGEAAVYTATGEKFNQLQAETQGQGEGHTEKDSGDVDDVIDLCEETTSDEIDDVQTGNGGQDDMVEVENSTELGLEKGHAEEDLTVEGDQQPQEDVEGSMDVEGNMDEDTRESLTEDMKDGPGEVDKGAEVVQEMADSGQVADSESDGGETGEQPSREQEAMDSARMTPDLVQTALDVAERALDPQQLAQDVEERSMGYTEPSVNMSGELDYTTPRMSETTETLEEKDVVVDHNASQETAENVDTTEAVTRAEGEEVEEVLKEGLGDAGDDLTSQKPVACVLQAGAESLAGGGQSEQIGSGQSGVMDSGQSGVVDSGQSGQIDSCQSGHIDSGGSGQIASGQSGQVGSGQPGEIGSGQSGVIDSGQPGEMDSGEPLVMDSGQPGVMDSGEPVVMDSGQSVVMDSGQSGVMDSGQSVVMDSVKFLETYAMDCMDPPPVDSAERLLDDGSACEDGQQALGDQLLDETLDSEDQRGGGGQEKVVGEDIEGGEERIVSQQPDEEMKERIEGEIQEIQGERGRDEKREASNAKEEGGVDIGEKQGVIEGMEPDIKQVEGGKQGMMIKGGDEQMNEEMEGQETRVEADVVGSSYGNQKDHAVSTEQVDAIEHRGMDEDQVIKVDADEAEVQMQEDDDRQKSGGEVGVLAENKPQQEENNSSQGDLQRAAGGEDVSSEGSPQVITIEDEQRSDEIRADNDQSASSENKANKEINSENVDPVPSDDTPTIQISSEADHQRETIEGSSLKSHHQVDSTSEGASEVDHQQIETDEHEQKDVIRSGSESTQAGSADVGAAESVVQGADERNTEKIVKYQTQCDIVKVHANAEDSAAVEETKANQVVHTKAQDSVKVEETKTEMVITKPEESALVDETKVEQVARTKSEVSDTVASGMQEGDEQGETRSEKREDSAGKKVESQEENKQGKQEAPSEKPAAEAKFDANEGAGSESNKSSLNIQKLIGVFESCVGEDANELVKPIKKPRTKPWQQEMSDGKRNAIVLKMINAIFPAQPAFLKDKRMSNLVKYVCQGEADIYSNAAGQDEYFKLLAEKVNKTNKQLEEKRKTRLQKKDGNSSGLETKKEGGKTESKIAEKEKSETKSSEKQESEKKSETKSQEKGKSETKSQEKGKSETKLQEKVKIETKSQEKGKSETKSQEKGKSETKSQEKGKTETKSQEKVKSETKSSGKQESQKKSDGKLTEKEKITKVKVEAKTEPAKKTPKDETKVTGKTEKSGSKPANESETEKKVEDKKESESDAKSDDPQSAGKRRKRKPRWRKENVDSPIQQYSATSQDFTEDKWTESVDFTSDDPLMFTTKTVPTVTKSTKAVAQATLKVKDVEKEKPTVTAVTEPGIEYPENVMKGIEKVKENVNFRGAKQASLPKAKRKREAEIPKYTEAVVMGIENVKKRMEGKETEVPNVDADRMEMDEKQVVKQEEKMEEDLKPEESEITDPKTRQDFQQDLKPEEPEITDPKTRQDFQQVFRRRNLQTLPPFPISQWIMEGVDAGRGCQMLYLRGLGTEQTLSESVVKWAGRATHFCLNQALDGAVLLQFSSCVDCESAEQEIREKLGDDIDVTHPSLLFSEQKTRIKKELDCASLTNVLTTMHDQDTRTVVFTGVPDGSTESDVWSLVPDAISVCQIPLQYIHAKWSSEVCHVSEDFAELYLAQFDNAMAAKDAQDWTDYQIKGQKVRALLLETYKREYKDNFWEAFIEKYLPGQTEKPVEVKTKPGKAGKPYFCTDCNIDCKSAQRYQSHVRGLLHTQKSMVASGQKDAEKRVELSDERRETLCRQLETLFCEASALLRDTQRRNRQREEERLATEMLQIQKEIDTDTRWRLSEGRELPERTSLMTKLSYKMYTDYLQAESLDGIPIAFAEGDNLNPASSPSKGLVAPARVHGSLEADGQSGSEDVLTDTQRESLWRELDSLSSQSSALFRDRKKRGARARVREEQRLATEMQKLQKRINADTQLRLSKGMNVPEHTSEAPTHYKELMEYQQAKDVKVSTPEGEQGITVPLPSQPKKARLSPVARVRSTLEGDVLLRDANKSTAEMECELGKLTVGSQGLYGVSVKRGHLKDKKTAEIRFSAFGQAVDIILLKDDIQVGFGRKCEGEQMIRILWDTTYHPRAIKWGEPIRTEESKPDEGLKAKPVISQDKPEVKKPEQVQPTVSQKPQEVKAAPKVQAKPNTIKPDQVKPKASLPTKDDVKAKPKPQEKPIPVIAKERSKTEEHVKSKAQNKPVVQVMSGIAKPDTSKPKGIPKSVKPIIDTQKKENSAQAECSNCYGVDHSLENCREPPYQCYRCKKTGHREMRCPDNVCFICQGRGHLPGDCNAPPICLLCRGKGHHWQDCPTKKPGENPSHELLRNRHIEPVSEATCINCKKTGHLTKDCPSEEVLDLSSTDEEPSPQKIEEQKRGERTESLRKDGRVFRRPQSKSPSPKIPGVDNPVVKTNVVTKATTSPGSKLVAVVTKVTPATTVTKSTSIAKTGTTNSKPTVTPAQATAQARIDAAMKLIAAKTAAMSKAIETSTRSTSNSDKAGGKATLRNSSSDKKDQPTQRKRSSRSRSKTPVRRRQRSPIRRRSRSKSPNRRRSRSKSPQRRRSRSKSPQRRRSRSRSITRNRLPISARLGRRSPNRRSRSRSPRRSRSPPLRRRRRSRSRSRTRSPQPRRGYTRWKRSRSPRKSKSPVRKRSVSPTSKSKWARSPARSKSPTPKKTTPAPVPPVPKAKPKPKPKAPVSFSIKSKPPPWALHKTMSTEPVSSTSSSSSLSSSTDSDSDSSRPHSKSKQTKGQQQKAKAAAPKAQASKPQAAKGQPPKSQQPPSKPPASKQKEKSPPVHVRSKSPPNPVPPPSSSRLPYPGMSDMPYPRSLSPPPERSVAAGNRADREMADREKEFLNRYYQDMAYEKWKLEVASGRRELKGTGDPASYLPPDHPYLYYQRATQRRRSEEEGPRMLAPDLGSLPVPAWMQAEPRGAGSRMAASRRSHSREGSPARDSYRHDSKRLRRDSRSISPDTMPRRMIRQHSPSPTRKLPWQRSPSPLGRRMQRSPSPMGRRLPRRWSRSSSRSPGRYSPDISKGSSVDKVTVVANVLKGLQKAISSKAHDLSGLMRSTPQDSTRESPHDTRHSATVSSRTSETRQVAPPQAESYTTQPSSVAESSRPPAQQTYPPAQQHPEFQPPREVQETQYQQPPQSVAHAYPSTETIPQHQAVHYTTPQQPHYQVEPQTYPASNPPPGPQGSYMPPGSYMGPPMGYPGPGPSSGPGWQQMPGFPPPHGGPASIPPAGIPPGHPGMPPQWGPM